MVPVREVVLEFDETEKATSPPPLPLLPELIVIQETLLVAIQEQTLGELTDIVPVPPLELYDLLVGEIV